MANGSSNRTFMELKPMQYKEKKAREEGSNRTFMELKVHIKSV